MSVKILFFSEDGTSELKEVSGSIEEYKILLQGDIEPLTLTDKIALIKSENSSQKKITGKIILPDYTEEVRGAFFLVSYKEDKFYEYEDDPKIKIDKNFPFTITVL